MCVEVNKPGRRAVQPANQLFEHLSKPSLTSWQYKCFHSPAFHTIMWFPDGLPPPLLQKKKWWRLIKGFAADRGLSRYNDNDPFPSYHSSACGGSSPTLLLVRCLKAQTRGRISEWGLGSVEEQHISVAGNLQMKLITPSREQITTPPPCRLGCRPGNAMECVRFNTPSVMSHQCRRIYWSAASKLTEWIRAKKSYQTRIEDSRSKLLIFISIWAVQNKRRMWQQGHIKLMIHSGPAPLSGVLTNFLFTSMYRSRAVTGFPEGIWLNSTERWSG